MANGQKKAKPEETIAQEPPAQESVAEEQLSQEQLQAQMQAAINSGDWKEVAKVARQIDTIAKQAEKAELEAKRAELVAVEALVRETIVGAITPLYDSGELDKADGVWIAWVFGDQAPTIRLTKTATRAPKAGGGTGKKFDISTDALLEKYGDEAFNEELTFKQAYDSNTDKNFRYGIRQKLLKKDKII